MRKQNLNKQSVYNSELGFINATLTKAKHKKYTDFLNTQEEIKKEVERLLKEQELKEQELKEQELKKQELKEHELKRK